MALIAPNGSGKSTLLRMIAGIEKPEGENAKYLVAKDITIAFLDQDPNFNPDSTIIDSVLDADVPAIKAVRNYEIAQLHADTHPELLEKSLHEMDLHKAWDIEAKVKEILFKLNLSNLEQKVKTLSGGQVKRLALAHVLLTNADQMCIRDRVRPSTIMAILSPNSALMVSSVTWVSSTTSCNNAQIAAVGPRPISSTQIRATSIGCNIYGSPDFLLCSRCAITASSYAFRILTLSTSSTGVLNDFRSRRYAFWIR